MYDQHPQDVAFVESTEDTGIDAKAVFDTLNQKHKEEMLSKFDLWQRGQHQNKYFHGFNELGYRGCFVFKRKQAGTYHRFYGFLHHPRTYTQPGYRVCILVQHAQKNRENTDSSELDFTVAISIKPQVIVAIKRAFPELIGGRNVTLDIWKR